MLAVVTLIAPQQADEMVDAHIRGIQNLNMVYDFPRGDSEVRLPVSGADC